MYQNHLKSLLKHKLLSPIPKISYSVCPECDPKMWILALSSIAAKVLSSSEEAKAVFGWGPHFIRRLAPHPAAPT